MSKTKTRSLATLAAVFSGPYDAIDIVSDERGWDAYALSTDKTSMMSAMLPASAFEEYEPLGRFVVDAEAMVAKLKNMGETTEVEMTHGGARMRFASDGFKDTMALFPVNEDSPRRMPRVALPAGCVCDLAPLRKVVKATDNQMVRIDVSGEGVRMQSFDESLCGPEAEIPAQSLMSVEGEGSAAYSTKSLEDFLSRFPKDAVASMELGNDLPLKMSFTVDGLEGVYFLAPWIEES